MKNNLRIEKLKKLDHLYYTCNPCEIEYLLGKRVSRGVVIAGLGKAAFFVDGRYRSGCSDLTCVTVHDEKLSTQKDFIKKMGATKVGFDPEAISYIQYTQIKDLDLMEAQPVKKMRMVKDEDEIVLLREAAALNYETFNHLVSKLQVGMTELEAAWIFEKYAREHGAEKMGFGPTVAFGKSSAVPHHDSGDVALEKGMPVLIDVGVVKSGYGSDMTRSFLFEGKDAEYEKYLQLVIEAQKEAREMARPGEAVCKLDLAIRNRFQEEGVLDAYKHAAGHGIGLELHEPPRIHFNSDQSMLLEEGMVITIEPGLYFDGKFGIRHEDTIIITSSGQENLYESWYRTR